MSNGNINKNDEKKIKNKKNRPSTNRPKKSIKYVEKSIKYERALNILEEDSLNYDLIQDIVTVKLEFLHKTENSKSGNSNY